MKQIWILIIVVTGLMACQHKEGSDQQEGIQSDSSVQEEGKSNSSNRATTLPVEKVRSLYIEWLARQVASGEFCHEKKCMKEMHDFHQNGADLTCMIGLPDSLDRVNYGDINRDGKTDAIGYAHLIQCDGGNALMNASICLCFVSSGANYDLIEEPEGLSHSLGIGRVSAILEDGTVEGKYLDYAGDDPRCCPSIEEERWFRFVNGKFERVEKR